MAKDPRDLRSYAAGTQRRLIAGGLLLILVAGNLLIWLVYGSQAAISALLCSAGALLPLLLIWGWLRLMAWIVRKGRDG